MATLLNNNNGKSIHASFWDALTKNSDSLALSQLWVCGFDKDTLRSIATMNSNYLEQYEPGSWGDHEAVGDVVMDPSNWDWVDGDVSYPGLYLWTRGVNFISDGIGVSRVGVGQSGTNKGLISDGRTDLNTANITFLESNISFVDGLIRPWSVLAGYRSLKDQRLRCDIEFFCLEKWSLYEPLRIRKSMLLRNAVPVNIDAEEYNYTGDKLIERQVQFAFDRYEMKVFTETNNKSVVAQDLEKMIKSQIINTGFRPDASPKIEISNKNYNTPSPVPIGMDIKPYPKNPGSSSNDNRSLLQKAEDLLGAAATTVARVQGAADKITSSVAQGLHSIGLNDQANKISDFNRDIHDFMDPATEIISTGQGAINAGQNIGSVIGDITGNGTVNSSDVAEALKGK